MKDPNERIALLSMIHNIQRSTTQHQVVGRSIKLRLYCRSRGITQFIKYFDVREPIQKNILVNSLLGELVVP